MRTPAQHESDDALLYRVWQRWPAHWPGRDLVDLDWFGDPGAVLWDQLADADRLDVLIGPMDPRGIENWASELAEFYLLECEGQGFDWALELDQPEDEVDRTMRDEFKRFLLAWRATVGGDTK